MKLLSGDSRIPVAIVLLVVASVFFAGCPTQTAGQKAATVTSSPDGNTGQDLQVSAVTSAETTSTPIPVGTVNDLLPSPTDALPRQNEVTIDVGEKDYLGTIPVIFQGGRGQIHVKKIDVTVYRGDGQVRTAAIGVNKSDIAEIEGTKQTDRVVVYVSFDNGDRMKTNDELSDYRTR
jgi:hypothetical protein